MKRRNFLGATTGAFVLGGFYCYLLSDKYNFERGDVDEGVKCRIPMEPDESEILLLASLAPSGHNVQPWRVKYIEPFHWIIENDKSRWLPAVDPTQRETILSIGAFLQNLEYASGNLGYTCQMDTLATCNQDEKIVEIRLSKSPAAVKYDIQQIKARRTVRSDFLSDVLKRADVDYLVDEDADCIHYIPNSMKEHQWLNEQTIEANRIQGYRDAAQKELADNIRFSTQDAKDNEDGLTLAGMEIDGITGWYLRNFYAGKDVMKGSFREQGINKVVKQVSQSAGWLLITSKDDSINTLLETGKRLQRLLLKIRGRNIAIHPMTQIIEEASTNGLLNSSMGINEPVQFILRTGYLKDYPRPVSLRRSLDKFITT
jgi:hypothetical protein